MIEKFIQPIQLVVPFRHDPLLVGTLFAAWLAIVGLWFARALTMRWVLVGNEEVPTLKNVDQSPCHDGSNDGVFASMVPGNVAEEHSNMAVPFERLRDEGKQIC